MANCASNNPAARLYVVLREAKKQSSEVSIKNVWAVVFSIDQSDLVHLMRCLIDLTELAESVEREISKLDVNHEVFLKHLPTVRKVLSVSNLDARWGDVRSLLAEEVLTSIEFCSERLNAVRPEIVLTADDFERVSQEVANLFSTVDKAELPDELRAVLLDVTHILQTALAQYRIRGISGLRQELFIVIDRLQRVHTQLNQEKANPAVQAVFKALGCWDTLTSVALNTPQLLGAVLKLM